MDLEKILLDFALSFATKLQMAPEEIKKNPNKAVTDMFDHVREVAKKHKQTPDLLTQYKEAIEREQYEVAHILKKQITDILENNGIRKRSKN